MGCRRATCTWALLSTTSRGLLGEGPVPGGVVAVGFLAELHDGVPVVGAVQLPQHGLLDAGVGLLIAELLDCRDREPLTTVMGRKSSRW